MPICSYCGVIGGYHSLGCGRPPAGEIAFKLYAVPDLEDE
jgi:hypothetical protein